ncbi:Uncharacterised protein [Yersinia pseudotuberculosis]|uniref:hypothetical protein n=1 Tax=Yersinia pseudotuberculosis complex TaxID=1649845 RepID=UPI0004F5D1A2|nr:MULTISPECIES: hypothetical protein [Yersinia pseudotuberculosis complex]AIN13859.1 hypothetical protein DJ40_2478 [Yersinia pseudotuberculosis]AJJ08285.1 hypothetical protein BZ20_2175 [Yersinia pseudotuberculosis]MBO1552764.1 hypothetical protein [Yersinia pseudotuberculosis]MBO1561737.1 hypothetical protein [Yersinia pseudotuberculosis]CNK41390.1 Uncharacterised protein [Yersinia pseudotuberculosis]
MLDISLVKPTGIFFIIERIYSRDGFIPNMLSIGNISPSVAQIHRTIISLSLKKEMYMEGKKITPGKISLWQTVKYSFGTPVTTKDTGKLVYNREFVGSLVSIKISPSSDILDIPKSLTSPKIKKIPDMMNFGKDPIPNVMLYGRHDVKFVMNNGGLDTPTAIAKYNENTKELSIIKDKASLSKLMLDMTNMGIRI